MKSPLISNLRFGSLLTYTAREGGDLGVRSRKLRDRIKNCHPPHVDRVCEILIQNLHDQGELSEIFDRERITLVPVPGSAPLPPSDSAARGALWSSLHYCKSFQRAGIECSVEPCLRRTVRVTKSAFAGPGERLDPQEHYDSMAVSSPNIFMGETIVLVDDFVTRGSTLIGAASRITESFPKANVVAFVIVRTVYSHLLEKLIAPCLGTITCENGRPNRDP